MTTKTVPIREPESMAAQAAADAKSATASDVRMQNSHAMKIQ